MRKYGILCAGLVVALASTTAKAQVVDTNPADGADGLAVWYDGRNIAGPTFPAPAAPYTVGTSLQSLKGKTVVANDVRAGNAGGPGDGQVLYISPRLPASPLVAGFGLHWTGKKVGQIVDQSNKSLYKYITVESRGATGEVIAALGLNTAITKGGAAGVGNKIENVVANANGALWNGNNSSVAAAGDGWNITAKAVKVPVSDNAGTPVYNAAGGAVAGASAAIYNVGNLAITAGVWEKPGTSVVNAINDSTYSVKDSVNNLLVTRVISGGGPLSAEDPDFGYNTVYTVGGPGVPGAIAFTGSNGGMPEANSGGDGLTIGTTSTNADATIIVQPKGDFTNDNLITIADNPFYNNAVQRLGEFANSFGPLRIREIWLGDFSNDGLLTVADNPAYNAYVTTTSANDCSVPANCP
jgi:hypothetical protein